MNKSEFIRLWSSRTGLSLKDSREVFEELINIFQESAEKREPLNLKGFGHMFFTNRQGVVWHNLATNEMEQPKREKFQTVGFRFSRNIKDMMIDDPEQRRLAQTRRAEKRRADLVDSENELEEDYEDSEEETE
jgi:nucleoid DNA-binding protein